MRLVEAVSERSRRRKFTLFMELMRPGPDTRVLDVGVDDLGYGDPGEWRTANFFEELYPWRGNITAVAVHVGARFRKRYPEVAYVQADGCSLPFPDREFDVYFSNAVIEHVGDRERQLSFVAEALRVAERVFITTPNRRFPLEVHTRLPFVHWLPRSKAGAIYERLGKGWAREIALLSSRELGALFPDPGRVRIISLGMTLVAVV